MENKTNWRHNNSIYSHSQHHRARNVPIVNFLSVKNKSNVARRGWNSKQRSREAIMNITDAQILFKEPLVMIFIFKLIFRSGGSQEVKKFPLSSIKKCNSLVDLIAVCGFYFPSYFSVLNLRLEGFAWTYIYSSQKTQIAKSQN